MQGRFFFDSWVRVAGLVLTALVASCTSTSEQSSPDDREALTLKVMEFNIEYGGHEVEFQSVIEAINESGADVVAIEEAWGNIPFIADKLGWRYFDPRMQLVSRLPLLAPPGSDGLYTFVGIRPGRVVAIGNVHLPSTPYGPFKVQDGATAEDILALEEKIRLPALKPYLDALTPLADDDIPVFLTGDFNAPSHLDWTAEAVGTRSHVEYALDWPVSKAVANAGFEDSYRQVHPDPVKRAGLTWPAARPFVRGYNPGLNGAAADRIDFIYSAGPAAALDSVLVGEKGAPDVEISVTPWPTDHRGVLSTFEVVPAAPPSFVAVEQRAVEVGADVHVEFDSPGEEAERVAVVPEGETTAATIDDEPTDDGADGTLTFSTEGWDPGAYEAVLTSIGNEELSRIAFWVMAPGAGPVITTGSRVYGVGEAIDVSWENAPGNRWDWVGIYERGADPNVASYISWFYTDSSVVGTEMMNAAAAGKWPLPAGSYSAYLLEDDSYNVLARADFTVRG